MSLQKHTILIISTFILLVSPCIKLHAFTYEPSASDSTRINYLTQNNILLSDSIINYGKLFLNTPYHYGSPGTSSFDCSGFTSYVYRNFGYNLERSSADQSRQFELVDRNQLKAGDLVFFSGRRRSKNVGHVGIVVATKENGEFNFIHAAVHTGVTISSSAEAYYTKRFLKASRVIAANPILTVVHKFMVSRNAKTEARAEAKAEAIAASSKVSTPVLAIMSKPEPTSVKQIKKTIPAEYHHVKKGETLSIIAQKYGMSLSELKKKNNLRNNKISLKQRIKVKDEETILVNQPENAKDNNTSAITEKNLEPTKVDLNATKTQIKTHKVTKGETLYSISRTYNISIDELKKTNNIANGKLHLGQELKLRQPEEPGKNTAIANGEFPKKGKTHKVVSGESLFSIAMKNNVSVDDLMKINNLPNGKIHPGQELLLAELTEANTNSAKMDKKADVKKNEKKEDDKNQNVEKNVTHTVKNGETLIEIAKKNNISVDELKKMNDLSDSKIKMGQKLILSQKSELKTSIAEKQENLQKQIQHKVKSGESYYSIAKEYGCSVDDLKEWNKKTGSKIKAGEKIIVYGNK